MATLTGLKVSELTTLALGSTGTLFLATSSSANSYKMYEKDLYATLNKFHISGAYQPKNEDWRFIHKTGAENITGLKTFVSSIVTPYIYDTGENSSIQVNNRRLYDSSSNISVDWDSKYLNGPETKSLDWKYRFLQDSDDNIKLSWESGILSGNWNASNIKVSGQALLNLTYANNLYVDRTNDQYITGIKRFNDTALFNNIGGYDGNDSYINMISNHMQTNSDLPSLNWSNKVLYNDDGSTNLDWGNKRLSGTWNAQSLTINNQNIITGNTVVYITGNQLISGVKSFKTIQSSGTYSRLITGKQLYIDEFYVNEDAEHTFHHDITIDNIGLGQQTALFGVDGSVAIAMGIGFWGSGTPSVQPVITGSRGGNVALASLLTGLHYMGIIRNNTTV